MVSEITDSNNLSNTGITQMGVGRYHNFRFRILAKNITINS